MTRIVILVVLALVFWAGNVAVAASKPHLKEITLMVRGMVCSSCAEAVEKALSKMDGVLEAKVNLKKDMATVRYDERRVTPLQMTEVLATVGYQAQPAQR
ncbi:MAG: cation transporter [Geobacteraceae bacterium]